MRLHILNATNIRFSLFDEMRQVLHVTIADLVGLEGWTSF